jgi:hypothetical protein
LRLCAFAREKYLFFRHIERSKKLTRPPRRTQKNNSRKAYLPQAGRQGAKDFSLRLCVLARKQRKKSRKAGKPLRVLDTSLHLCSSARKKKSSSAPDVQKN